MGIDSGDYDSVLAPALAAAIEQVHFDCGLAEDAVPNASLSQAALLLAVTVSKSPDAPFGVAAVFDAGGLYVARMNPNYLRLLKGSRLSFGVA